MEQEDRQICPWCQTEIVWDPEIGPEEECPHCFNELSGYRSITFKLDSEEGDTAPGKSAGGTSRHGRHSHDDDDDWEEDYGEDADAGKAIVADPEGLQRDRSRRYEHADSFDDAYGEKVEQCLDTQEEAPECVSCRELMLLAGHSRLGGEFVPYAPETLGKPFLQVPVQLDVYVCPGCFRTETVLSEKDRLHMVQTIKES